MGVKDWIPNSTRRLTDLHASLGRYAAFPHRRHPPALPEDRYPRPHLRRLGASPAGPPVKPEDDGGGLGTPLISGTFRIRAGVTCGRVALQGVGSNMGIQSLTPIPFSGIYRNKSGTRV